MNDNPNIIEYIKNDIGKIERRIDEGFHDVHDEIDQLRDKIDIFMSSFVLKSDYKADIEEINNRLNDLERMKLDKSDFEKLSNNISRLNWIVITGVVGGVLALIFK